MSEHRHEIVFFRCGHLKMQCRCISPKTRVVLPEDCPDCRAGKVASEQTMSEQTKLDKVTHPLRVELWDRINALPKNTYAKGRIPTVILIESTVHRIIEAARAEGRAERGTCATCRHWEETTPKETGLCSGLPTRAPVLTRSGFYCAAHVPKEDA